MNIQLLPQASDVRACPLQSLLQRVLFSLIYKNFHTRQQQKFLSTWVHFLKTEKMDAHITVTLEDIHGGDKPKYPICE